MTNQELKDKIDLYIYTNNVKAITGAILNDILNDVVDTYSANDIQTYYSSTTPTGTITTGSLWINSTNAYIYRYEGSWVVVYTGVISDEIKVGSAETYTTFKDAYDAGVSKVKFTSDVTDIATFTINRDVEINLNNFKWTLNLASITLDLAGSEVKIYNGKIDYKSTKVAPSFITTSTFGNITIKDDVTITSISTAASIFIDNSITSEISKVTIRDFSFLTANFECTLVKGGHIVKTGIITGAGTGVFNILVNTSGSAICSGLNFKGSYGTSDEILFYTNRTNVMDITSDSSTAIIRGGRITGIDAQNFTLKSADSVVNAKVKNIINFVADSRYDNVEVGDGTNPVTAQAANLQMTNMYVKGSLYLNGCEKGQFSNIRTTRNIDLVASDWNSFSNINIGAVGVDTYRLTLNATSDNNRFKNVNTELAATNAGSNNTIEEYLW